MRSLNKTAFASRILKPENSLYLSQLFSSGLFLCKVVREFGLELPVGSRELGVLIRQGGLQKPEAGADDALIGPRVEESCFQSQRLQLITLSAALSFNQAVETKAPQVVTHRA